MKKAFLISLISLLIISPAVFAESWDDFSDLDRAWDGQKSITNKEFEDAINTLEGKQKQKEEKQQKRKAKKISGGGTSLHSELAPGAEIQGLTPLKNKNDEGLLLNVPVNLIIDETPLDKGYYKVIAERDKNNDIYLSFYQSQYFKGKVRACETNDDYESEDLDFVKLIPYNKNFVKIIFGSLDFNAYAYIRYGAEEAGEN